LCPCKFLLGYAPFLGNIYQKLCLLNALKHILSLRAFDAF
jgi:DNA phosphorothioation-dependent restriction protein DptG